VLVGGAGFTQREAAVLCDCAVGTVKSRVGNARASLTLLLGFLVSTTISPRREGCRTAARRATMR
jgi:RNA polymerase sigma-70 factor (ECF subfamily)